MAMSLSAFLKLFRNLSFGKASSCRSFSKCRRLSTTAEVDLDLLLDKVEGDTSASNVFYPPVKPKFPPGQWGDMDHTYAWQWHKTKEDLMGIPNVQGRLDYLNSTEMTCLNAMPYRAHPDYLKFASYITKSHLLPWVEKKPSVYSEIDQNLDASNFVDLDLEMIKQSLIDQIILENETVVRSDSWNKQKSLSKSILRSIVDILVTHLGEKCKHLRSSQYDEDVIVRTLWDRHGIERQRRKRLGVEGHFALEPVLDQRIISSCTFDGVLRNHYPLPQLVQRDSGISVESPAPTLDYKYSNYGVMKNKKAKLKNLLAGHILGDPSEYGLIGFVSNYNKSDELDEQFGLKTAKDFRLGRGLLMTFSWLAAQAYNQGFNGLMDLTYPLVSQTVMSDGRKFSFLACQLNTLELWKPDDANKMVNLCWYTDEMSLYDCIENGEVKGFNDDVLKMLISMFLLESSTRNYDMKPTITEKDMNYHLKGDFIPIKEEVEEEEEKEEEYIV